MSNLNLSDNSVDNILNKINYFEDQNDSNSGNKYSLGSNYNDYLDLVKKNINKNYSEDKSESLIDDSKILNRSILNNTILNQSNNISFNLKYNFIEEVSKEYEIEEEDEEKWENEKILKNQEFSFNSHKNILLLLDNKDNNNYSKIIDISINNNFYDIYYIKSNLRQINNKININKDYFEIKINSLNYKQTFYCNSIGMIDTKKNTNKKSIIFGRQINDSIIPYDIELDSNSISKIHCEIITKFGFQENRKYPKKFLLILKNLKYNKKLKKLEKYLIYKIFDFLKPPKDFFIRDLNSKFGTYLRTLKNNLQKKDIYIIGDDLKIIVKEKSYKNKKIYDNITYFIWNKFNDILFIGIDESNINKMKENYENINLFLIKNIFIFFELITNVSNIKKYILIFSNNNKQEFSLGRISENNICLNIETISRNHCKIINENNDWYIEDNNSLNGIWNNISNFRIENFNNLYPININSEIKIHDYFITFNFHN